MLSTQDEIGSAGGGDSGAAQADGGEVSSGGGDNEGGASPPASGGGDNDGGAAANTGGGSPGAGGSSEQPAPADFGYSVQAESFFFEPGAEEVLCYEFKAPSGVGYVSAFPTLEVEAAPATILAAAVNLGFSDIAPAAGCNEPLGQSGTWVGLGSLIPDAPENEDLAIRLGADSSIELGVHLLNTTNKPVTHLSAESTFRRITNPTQVVSVLELSIPSLGATAPAEYDMECRAPVAGRLLALHGDTSWNATLTVSTSSQQLLGPEELMRVFATTADHDPVELEADEPLFATCESSEGEGGSCHALGLFVTAPDKAGAWGCTGQAE